MYSQSEAVYSHTRGLWSLERVFPNHKNYNISPKGIQSECTRDTHYSCFDKAHEIMKY